MSAHTIPSICTLTKAMSKNQVRIELDMYFDELMRVATNTDSEISAHSMHQYVIAPVALKTLMCMLADKLDRGARSMYMDATEARVLFQQDVTIEHADTITDYQASHQFANIDHREDVKDLVFLQLYES